jgi:serine/threonine protein kinase
LRTRLADYQLLGSLGSSDTWLATAPPRLSWTEPVVVTELAPADWAARSTHLARLAGVESTYLPRLIEVGQTDEEDGTVTWVVRADGRPDDAPGPAADLGTVLRRLAAAARGAHALHEAGLVHGDIRPEAILSRGDDTLLEPPVRRLPTAGVVVAAGTPPADFDPLEPAAIWGEGRSRASDIWALGVTAHRLLTGQPVHPALATDLIVHAVQRVLLQPPTIAPGLAGPVDEVIRTCLAPDPADRPKTAADLADAFERVAAGR